MVQNVVLNNSDRAFGEVSDAIRASDDRTKVIPTPGTAAAVAAQQRAQLEAGTLVSAGAGIHADHAA